MASSFDIFRRNQRAFLAVFGIAIMIVFVVGSAQFDDVVRLWGSSSSTQGTIVRWKHGSITDRELGNAFRRHQYLLVFLRNLVEETVKRSGTPKVPNVNVRTVEDVANLQNPGVARANSPEEYFQKVVLAKKAEEMGLVVNDQSVLDFLEKLSDKTLSQSDYSRIMQLSLASGGKALYTPQQIFDQLRMELTAQSMLMMVSGGFGTTSPAVAWDYYNRMNRQVKVELLPLTVEEYKSRVEKKPTDQELKDLFEKYKGNVADKSSPTPGFYQRKQVAFQYFKVEFDRFLQEEMPNITDEEIKKEYELGISRGEYKVQELPKTHSEITPEKPEAEKKSAEPSSDAKKEEAKPDETKKDEAKKEEPAKKDEPAKSDVKNETKKDADAKAEQPKKDEKPAADNKSEDKKPEAAKPEEKKSDDKKPEEKKDDKKNESGAQLQGSATFFVTTADAEKSSDEKAATSGDKKADPETKPAADTKPASEKKPEAETKPATAEAKTETEKKQEAEKKADDAPKFKPLDEVRDEVRKRLAKPRAEAARKAAIEEAKKAVERYGRERREWETFKEETKKPEPKFDFEALAVKLKFTLGKTELIDEVAIEKHELGQSNPYLMRYNGFYQELARYRVQAPAVQTDTDFLWWKIDEKEGKTPDFTEAKDAVIDAWKKNEALEIAKKDAEKKAEDARAKNDSLKSIFGKDVLEPTEFTWLRFDQWGMMYGGSGHEINTVEGVEMPGNSFMEKVFSLKEGEVTVAVNQPETMVYVVRLAKEVNNVSERRDRFLQAGYTFALRGLAGRETNEVRRQWYMELEKEMGVQWDKNVRMVVND